jgi:hypothetical protein
MKLMSLLLFLTFTSTTAAEVLNVSDITITDITEVNFVLMAVVQDVMSGLNNFSPCSQIQNEVSILANQVETKTKNKLDCQCTKKSFIGKLLGNIEEEEYILDSGNDNLFHGAISKAPPSIKKYNGDDLDRTFGIGTSYSILGSDGKFKISLDSTGFSKYTKVNNSYYDENDYHYLIFHELNTLDLKYDNFSNDGDSKSKKYKIYELKFENETDNGNISRAIQDKWHHSIKYSDGSHPRYYHYLTEKDDLNTIKAMFGTGLQHEDQFGSLQCIAKVEAKTGISYHSKVDGVFGLKGDLNLKSTAIPYFVISIWGQLEKDFRGISKEGAVEFSFPMKMSMLKVVPYLGFEKHSTPFDSAYTGTSPNPNEIYSKMGFKVNWK